MNSRTALSHIALPWTILALLAAVLLTLAHLAGPGPAPKPSRFPPTLEWPTQ